MSAVIIRNEIVHYEVLGRGRPVIFLHSWIGSWRDWLQTMQSASAAYRCYALDLWGFGDTARANGRYKLHEQARLVEEFIETLGIRKVALLGSGLGGVVAARFALDQPKTVDRLMLVNTPVDADDINPRLKNTGSVDLSLWLYSGMQGGDNFRREAEKADAHAIRDALEGIGADSLTRLTAELGVPCLFVRAENDPAVERRASATPTEKQAAIHEISFETGGHHPMLREPVVFGRLTTDFLGLKSGESPGSLRLKDEWKRRFR